MKIVIGLNFNIDASLVPIFQTVEHEASNAKVLGLILREYMNS